jgi:hypothetical protein
VLPSGREGAREAADENEVRAIRFPMARSRCANPAWLGATLLAAGCAAPAATPLLRAGFDPYAAFAPAPQEKRRDGRTSELPKIEVVGDRVTGDTLVGANRQPEWTTRRPFVRSRVHVLAPWQVELSTWSRTEYEDSDQESGRFQQQIALGLPHRFQVDYYHNFATAEGAGYEDAGPQLEARWALAEWGRIPLNPAIDAEYEWDRTGADSFEARLLLGDSPAPRWHAAANLIWEQETSGARATELAVSGAASCELIERRLMLGAEITAARVTGNGSRNDPAHEIAAGPSVQIRLTERIHLDIVPMFGVSDDATDVDLFIVFGIDLGGGDERSRLAPISRRSP